MSTHVRRSGRLSAAALAVILLAAAAAPMVNASAGPQVLTAGVVPQGGTSDGTASFTFTEHATGQFPSGGSPNALIITIRDSAGDSRVQFG